MNPTVCRIVHYRPEEGVCWAAIIRHVETGPVINQDAADRGPGRSERGRV